MGWFNRLRKGPDEFRVGVGTLGLDVNSSRLRAVSCETGRPPRPVFLDDPHEELPLAVGLERPVPEVGRAALGLAKRLPHLACFDFLADLGQPREWKAGKHRLTATGLLSLAFDRLHAACPRPDNVTLVLPTYLNTPKVTSLVTLLNKAGLPVRGSAALPLALVAACDPSQARPRLALVVDADDHALTGALVQCEAGQARLTGTAAQPRLNVRIWKEKLLNALADRCVRTCRRDPRDTPTADQALYEQIDDALDRLRAGQKATLSVRGANWYQDLVQQADDFDGYCAALVKQAVALLAELAQQATEPPGAVWLTHAAGRLPGLVAALHDHTAEGADVTVLPADAGARAAVALAARWSRDELPRTHLDGSVLLPEGQGRLRDTGTASFRAFRVEK
ncbi:MAG: hypothetical protein ACJ8F7_10300 [Gemmataceae bacterium]